MARPLDGIRVLNLGRYIATWLELDAKRCLMINYVLGLYRRDKSI